MGKVNWVVILVTTSSEEEARQIAQLLLDRKKVACANIVPVVHSMFWWQDKLESAQESLLILKTKASLISEVTEIVKKAHRYEVPEIIALPIIGGNEDYLKWMGGVVRVG